mmetsp:Transcript_11988/g.32111  ORF Transcript_11988/g.32111 Transcript_11988/m.32111 type:complete len:238 (-) Transcript_11988:120-833(-)
MSWSFAPVIPSFFSISARLLSKAAICELSMIGIVLGAKLTSQVTMPSSPEPFAARSPPGAVAKRSNWIARESDMAPGPPPPEPYSAVVEVAVAPFLQTRKSFSRARSSSAISFGSEPMSSVRAARSPMLDDSQQRSSSKHSNCSRAQRWSIVSAFSVSEGGSTTPSCAAWRWRWASVLATSFSMAAASASFLKNMFIALRAFRAELSMFSFSTEGTAEDTATREAVVPPFTPTTGVR